MVIDNKESIFPKISDFLDCLVVVIDLQGKIVYFNQYCERYTGIDFPAAKGKYFWDLFCIEDEKELYKAFFSTIRPEEYPMELEAQIPGSDNEVLTVLWKYNSLQSDKAKHQYHLLTGIDITSYKKANTKLQEIGEKYRTVIHVSPVSVITMDPTFKVKSWSSAAEKMFGWTEKNTMEYLLFNYLDDEESLFKKYCYRAMKGEIINDFELTTKKKNGAIININCFLAPMRNFNGSIDGAVLIALDITDRKKTEKDLRESEKRYREILQSMEDGYYEVNLDGKIIDCNSAATRMLGYEEKELVGLSYKSICKDYEKVFEVFNRAFKDNEPQFSVIMDMIRKDGSLSNAEISLSLSRDREGNITGFRGLGRDITDRIQADLKLRYLSYHDTLTGVYNRTFFEKELERLEDSTEYPIAIVLADLDGLKLINDTLGHKEGDKYLIECAKLLKKNLRNTDMLSRIGGDEFALILPKTKREAGESLISRIRISIDEYNKKGLGVPLSISMGLAICKDNNQPLEEAMKYADGVMYSDKLQRSNNAREKIIKALLASLYDLESNSENKIEKLQDLSLQLGAKVGLNEKQLKELELLIQVYQLGKVTIPKHILNKNGKLTEQEWETVRQHTERGYRIAGASPDLNDIAELILKHQENWDGSGYPLGLKGEEIPIHCRILGITNAYVAMIHDRPYSKAFGKVKALDELKCLAGIQFDPNLVDGFTEIVK